MSSSSTQRNGEIMSNGSAKYEKGSEDQWSATQSQLDAIAEEIKKKQPLTSQLQDITTLNKNLVVGNAMEYLHSNYPTWRRIRGDGNCYYRAFLYALCECLVQPEHKEELKRIQTYVKSTIDTLTQFGYDRFAVEMFWEELIELLDFIAEPDEDIEKKGLVLHGRLNEEQGVSEYATWYLRVVVAAYLKADPTRFIDFLDSDCYDIATFCSREVEPMGKECGMVQVLALAEAFQVLVKIEYLDASAQNQKNSGLVMHRFGKEGGMEIHMLYRPGHYDILYPKPNLKV